MAHADRPPRCARPGVPGLRAPPALSGGDRAAQPEGRARLRTLGQAGRQRPLQRLSAALAGWPRRPLQRLSAALAGSVAGFVAGFPRRPLQRLSAALAGFMVGVLPVGLLWWWLVELSDGGPAQRHP